MSIARMSLLLLLLSLVSVFNPGLVTIAAPAQKTWCVAKPSSDGNTLNANQVYACAQVNCSVLHKGGPCSLPDYPINLASVAMNLYYQANGRNTWNCNFGQSGLIVTTDPSYGSCKYA